MVEKRRASFSQILKGNNTFLINLICPDNTSISTTHQIRDTVSSVLQTACKQLNITRTDIFGVAVHEYNEYRFISNNKSLYKFLPSDAIINEVQRKDINAKERLVSNVIKTCRLYLRVKIFLINVDALTERNLYFYYQQAKLDALRYQNWLQLPSRGDIFYTIAANSIWLKYGDRWYEEIKNKTMPLHYFLPMCEHGENMWDILTNKLTQLNMTFDNVQVTLTDKLPLHKSDSNDSRQSTASTRKSTVTEHDVIIIEDRSTVMLNVIKETMKLPYYGVHFYHVSMVTDDGKTMTNCKLGIGPLGITVMVSPFFTTWEESLHVSWSRVNDMKHEKNILNVIETSEELHQFVCLNDKEAKYLFNQLKEYHLFQQHSTDGERQRTKKNSIGVFKVSDEESTLSVARRSSSFSMLLFPRKSCN